MFDHYAVYVSKAGETPVGVQLVWEAFDEEGQFVSSAEIRRYGPRNNAHCVSVYSSREEAEDAYRRALAVCREVPASPEEPKEEGAAPSLEEALEILRRVGPLRAVRVSSAQARGYAKQFAYWGAVRYRVQWSAKHNWPVAVPVERASSDRRARHLAEQDAYELADRENRFILRSIGKLTPEEVRELARECQQGLVEEEQRRSRWGAR
jgi:hypothetical protein